MFYYRNVCLKCVVFEIDLKFVERCRKEVSWWLYVIDVSTAISLHDSVYGYTASFMKSLTIGFGQNGHKF